MRLDSRAKLGIIAFVTILIAAALMHSGLTRVFGIAPNLVLVSLVVFSFFSDNILFFALLTILGSILVRATPAIFDPLATVTTVLALLVFIFERRMVWPGSVGTAIMVGITTVLTYAFINLSFLASHFGLVLAELVYNVVIGLILFECVHLVIGRRMRNAR